MANEVIGMAEYERYQRRLRLLALLTMALAVLAAWGWLRRPVAPADAVGRISTPEEMEALTDRLASVNRSERLRLIHALGQTGGARALDGLMTTLRTARNPRERCAVLDGLGRLGSTAALSELEQIARDGPDNLRYCALNALGSSRSEQAAEMLHGLLGNAQLFRYRSQLLSALGATGRESARETLVAIAIDEKDPHRTTAISALGVMGDPNAFETLAKLARTRTTAVRSSAIAALGEQGTPRAKSELLRMLSSADPQVRSSVVMALSNYPEADVKDRLLKRLDDKSADVAQSTVWALSSLDLTDKADVLGQALTSRHRQVRLAAVSALGHMGTSESRARLADLVSDPELGASAAWALSSGGVGDPDPVLLSTLEGDAPTDVRYAAVNALSNGNLDDEGAKALRGLVQSGAQQVATRALHVLADKQGGEALPLLLERYENGSRSVSAAALQALTSVDDPRAQAVIRRLARAGDSNAENYALHLAATSPSAENRAMLRDLLQSGNASTRSRAAAALARYGDPEGQQLLFEQLRKGESNAVWQLGQMTDRETRAKLMAALSDGTLTDEVKQNIVSAISNTAATPELVAAADNPSSQVAAAALQALGQKGGAEAEQALKTALSSGDKERKQAALRGFEQLGSAAAVDAIAGALNDEETFETAASILARVGGKEAMSHLTNRFSSANEQTRLQILYNVSSSAGKHGRALLEQALDDPSEAVVAQAARTLAGSGDKRVAPRLLAVMQRSESVSVRQAIAQSLKATGGLSYERHKSLIDQVLSGSS
jgi:HEAT repeat protein